MRSILLNGGVRWAQPAPFRSLSQNHERKPAPDRLQLPTVDRLPQAPESPIPPSLTASGRAFSNETDDEQRTGRCPLGDDVEWPVDDREQWLAGRSWDHAAQCKLSQELRRG